MIVRTIGYVKSHSNVRVYSEVHAGIKRDTPCGKAGSYIDLFTSITNRALGKKASCYEAHK
jgi:hypothetical protein